jgi:hypothetical protein
VQLARRNVAYLIMGDNDVGRNSLKTGDAKDIKLTAPQTLCHGSHKKILCYETMFSLRNFPCSFTPICVLQLN